MPADNLDENLTAYPRLILNEDRVTPEASLSRSFYERNPAHFIGLRAGDGIWPQQPENAEAVRLYAEGHRALYEEKDAVAAIRALEAALEVEPSYLQAWVALAIACITDNTEESLEQAQAVLEQLASLTPERGGWLTPEASSIINQNLGYLHVHRYRQNRDISHLPEADRCYQAADTLSAGKDRIELLCPWAFVKLEMGDRKAATALWTRAQKCAAARNAPRLLSEYAAKYASLRTLLVKES